MKLIKEMRRSYYYVNGIDRVSMRQGLQQIYLSLKPDLINLYTMYHK